jgi:hypothetical protein
MIEVARQYSMSCERFAYRIHSLFTTWNADLNTHSYKHEEAFQRVLSEIPLGC